MKYGETLPQRSVLEWLPHNIDYEEVKRFIKQHTLHRPRVAPSDPTDFEDDLWTHLVAQLDRVHLFVRSKVGEIERRIAACERKAADLRKRQPSSLKFGSLVAKLLQDIDRASYEVQCLSRYVNVQRTGFTKLLKKYTKWTGSSRLPERFRVLLDSPTAFHCQNFEAYIVKLSQLFEDARTASPAVSRRNSGMGETTPTQQSFSAQQIRPYHSEVFWVHYNNIIELQVFLLKHLTLQTASPVASLSSSPTASRAPSRRTSNASLAGKDQGLGLVVLDDLERFSRMLNSSTIEQLNATPLKTAAQIRWNVGDPAAHIVVADPAYAIDVKIKRKLAPAIFSLESDPRLDRLSSDHKHSTSIIRSWSRENSSIKPLAKITLKRTSFTAFDDVAAVLDSDIKFSQITDLAAGLEADTDADSAQSFPHAVLNIHWHTARVPDFVRDLRRSHLVESVPGFATDVHAVAVLYEPANMSPPFWLPALGRDILKTPTLPPRAAMSRRTSYNLGASSSKNTSAGTGSSTAVAAESSTSADIKGKGKARAFSPTLPKQIGTGKYWNEFDDGELAKKKKKEGGGYMITLEREHRPGTPDSDLLEDEELGVYIRHRMRDFKGSLGRLFKRPQEGERMPLLKAPGSASSTEVEEERYDGFSHAHDLNLPRQRRHLHLLFLGASLLIMVFTFVVTFVRHKHAVLRDVGMLAGVMLGLGLAVAGLTVFLMGEHGHVQDEGGRRGRGKWVHRVAVWIVFGIVCVGNGVCLGGVGREEVGRGVAG